MADLWSSARLVYRGIDDEDEDTLALLSGDPISFLNVAPTLPGKIIHMTSSSKTFH